MIGIEEIATYIPSSGRDNFALARQFGKTEDFVKNRLGGHLLPVMEAGMDTSDLAGKALVNLLRKAGMEKNEIECLVVCTQNPDGNGLPHTSAIIQEKIGLSEQLAAFDISLGCSGFVYGLDVIRGFMHAAGLHRGVLITADPYSKIIDKQDPNTVMLFGDAATATLISDHNPKFSIEQSIYATYGKGCKDLKNIDGKLYMNGRNVFNFVATKAVQQIRELLKISNLSKDAIDCYLLHQGSRYIVETMANRLEVTERVILSMDKTGNTVSSSIPLILEGIMNNRNMNKVLLSGFGVGFSIGTMILNRIEYN